MDSFTIFKVLSLWRFRIAQILSSFILARDCAATNVLVAASLSLLLPAVISVAILDQPPKVCLTPSATFPHLFSTVALLLLGVVPSTARFRLAYLYIVRFFALRS